MGQTIEINGVRAIDRILVVDTDRSLAGQDGEAFNGVEAAGRSETFPGKLAHRVFEVDASVDHVFVMSNTVSIRRMGEWDDAAIDAVSDVIAEFFRFYD